MRRIGLINQALDGADRHFVLQPSDSHQLRPPERGPLSTLANLGHLALPLSSACKHRCREQRPTKAVLRHNHGCFAKFPRQASQLLRLWLAADRQSTQSI